MPMYSDYFSKVKAIKDDDLPSDCLLHLEVVRVVARAIPAARNAKIYGGDIVAKDSRLSLAGLYDVDSRRILISRDRLERLSATMNTGIHELGHHISKADDGSLDHYHAMCEVAEKSAELATSGKLDSLVKGARW